MFCSKDSKATSKNDKSGFIKKQYNFIDSFTGTKQQVTRIRAELFNVHGISSPEPVKYKSEWVLRLNAPNSYRCFALSGVKGWNNAQPTKRDYKNVCWYVPVPQKNKQIKMFGDDYKRWDFRQGVYNIHEYTRDNSVFLDG